MLQRLQHAYGYDTLNCFTADPADLDDGSGRTDKRDVILHDRLKEAAIGLNPEIPESAIDDALKLALVSQPVPIEWEPEDSVKAEMETLPAAEETDERGTVITH